MNEVITHRFHYQQHTKSTYTVWGLCGYFEVYDLEIHKKHQTPFIREGFNCEECLREEGLALLERL